MSVHQCILGLCSFVPVLLHVVSQELAASEHWDYVVICKEESKKLTFSTFIFVPDSSSSFRQLQGTDQKPFLAIEEHISFWETIFTKRIYPIFSNQKITILFFYISLFC